MESKLVVFMLIFYVHPQRGAKHFLVELAHSSPSGGHEEDKEKGLGHEEDHQHGKDHGHLKDHGHGKDHEHKKDHGRNRKGHGHGKDHGTGKDHGHKNGHRRKQGKRKDHAVATGNGWDYDLTPEERCRELKALCKGRPSCLEAMNTHSQICNFDNSRCFFRSYCCLETKTLINFVYTNASQTQSLNEKVPKLTILHV